MCTVQAAADRTERAAPHLTKPNRRAPCAVGQLKPLLKGPPAASLPPGSLHPCTAPQHSAGPGSLAESHQGALPAASGLDSPLVAANNLCFTALGSAQDQHRFYLLLSGICKYNYTTVYGKRGYWKPSVTRRFTCITAAVPDKGL